ncbi:MAG: hypothetical protein ACYC1M_13475 [Armatimonadota bacterium]
MRGIKWIAIILVLFFLCICLPMFFPDWLLPVARGLSGHYYFLDGDNNLRCYDLSNPRRSYTVYTPTGGERIGAFDVSYNNTRLVAIFYEPTSRKSEVRWYDIRGLKLVNEHMPHCSIPVADNADDLCISPDGKTCILLYNNLFDKPFKTPAYVVLDLDTGTQTNMVIPRYFATWYSSWQVPKWDATGRRLSYEDKWGHTVVYDIISKSVRVLPDSVSSCISPDLKLLYIREDIRTLDDNSDTPISTDTILMDRSPDNLIHWSPDSRGFDYYAEYWPRYALQYYDIKTRRFYRMPVSYSGLLTRWVK